MPGLGSRRTWARPKACWIYQEGFAPLVVRITPSISEQTSWAGIGWGFGFNTQMEPSSSRPRNISEIGASVPLLYNGQKTTVQQGDHLVIDVDSWTVRILRNEEPLPVKGDGDSYYLSLEYGVQLNELARLIADACGLSFREVNRDDDLYEFEFV